MINVVWQTRIAGESGFELRLIEGDARSVEADVVVFGRSKLLRSHYIDISRDYFVSAAEAMQKST